MKKTLYHGSDKIVKTPKFGVGKSSNDYGSGFYTTEDKEKAKNWAWTNGSEDSYCNEYEIDFSSLNILYLDKYGSLAWVAEIIYNRGTKSDIAETIGSLIIEKYKIDTSKADIIVGYRADDSYMNVVDSFLENQVTLSELERFFRKGDLGEQVFIKSEKAFKELKFKGFEKLPPFDANSYSGDDIKARREVNKFLINRQKEININGYIPIGITAKEIVNNNYEYNEEYGIYTLNEQNDTLYNQRRDKYEIEL